MSNVIVKKKNGETEEHNHSHVECEGAFAIIKSQEYGTKKFIPTEDIESITETSLRGF